MRDENRQVGGTTQAVFDARSIDATYPEVGSLLKGNAVCTATILPNNLILTAAHCGFVTFSAAAADDAMPGRLSHQFVYDVDGDPRTPDDRRSFALSGAYAIGVHPTSGKRWDLAIAALYIPPGETGPWEMALAAKANPHHRIVTNTHDSVTPAELADWVVHVPFDPATVLAGGHSAPVPVQRVGLGASDLVIDADGGFVADAHADVTRNDAGEIIKAGPTKFRFLAPAFVRGFYQVPEVTAFGLLRSSAASASDPYLVVGDSGGPMFVHPGNLVAGASASDEYILGVLSTAQQPDPVPATAPFSTHATTFDDPQGAWLEARIRDLLADRDADGIPTAVDNCPNIPNKDQANCNRDLEDIRRTVDPAAIPLGDVCDPVPCPGTARTALDLAPATDTVCGSGHRLAGRFCFGHRVQPQVSLTTIGAGQELSACTTPTGCTPPATVRGHWVADVATRMRFCTSNSSRAVNCKAPGNVTRDRALLADPDGVSGNSWWRISYSDSDFVDGQPLVYGNTTRTVTWNHSSDATAWAASGNFVPPDSTGSCTPVGGTPGHAPICLNGHLWTLGDTLVGADSAHAAFFGPTGSGAIFDNAFHQVGSHADHLSASLTKMNPEYTGGSYGPGVGWEEKFRRPVILTLPDPPWWTDAAVPYVRNEALILSAVNSNALVVHANGDAESMGASVSGALYNLLAQFETMPDAAPTQQWLDLADPQTRADRPLAVVARKQSNGSWKFDSVLDYYGGLNLESDYGNPLRYGSVASLPTTPMVYSPADDALWTAGTNVLQRHAAGTSSFVNVLPANADIKPANVKAIAVDAARQAAWVVDYTATGLPRLLRFAKNGAGVWTGAILSQGSTAGAATDKHYLNLLPDGRVIYARTNVAANTRVVGRFSYAGGGVIAALLTGSPNYYMAAGAGGGVVSGALLARPLVDGSGYHQMLAGQAAPVGGDPAATPPDTTYPFDLPPGEFPANDIPGLPPPGPNPSGPASAGYASDDGTRSGIPVPPSAVFP